MTKNNKTTNWRIDFSRDEPTTASSTRSDHDRPPRDIPPLVRRGIDHHRHITAANIIIVRRVVCAANWDEDVPARRRGPPSRPNVDVAPQRSDDARTLAAVGGEGSYRHPRWRNRIVRGMWDVSREVVRI